MHNHSKLQLKYKQPSLRTVRNLVEWKSDNYRIKGTTSIQTRSRGTDMEGLVRHPCVVDKNLGGISQKQGVLVPHQRPHPRAPVPRRYILKTSGCKNQQRLNLWKNFLEHQAVPLKEPTHKITCSDSLLLSSSNTVALERHRWHTGKN